MKGKISTVSIENVSFLASEALPLPRRLRHAFRIVDIDSNAESPLFINLKII